MTKQLSIEPVAENIDPLVDRFDNAKQGVENLRKHGERVLQDAAE